MFKIIPFLFTLIIIIPVSVFTQVSVIDVTTDSINVFDRDNKTLSSNKLAMAASLALPGLGQQYLGKSTAAFVFTTVDVLALFGVIFFETSSRKLESDAYGYAASTASINGSGKDERFWNMVGLAMDFDEYNNSMDLNRQSSEKYTDPTYYWLWPDKSDLDKYKKIRFNSRKMHTFASVCLGALVLNRIISFVDIKASSKYKKESGLASVKINPSVSPGLKSAGFAVSAHF